MQLPDLSVVIPFVNAWNDLEGCLKALSAQRGDHQIEILVIDRTGQATDARLEWCSGAVLVEAARSSTIPQLRALAFDRARAELVAVIEDHIIVPPDWAERLLNAYRATNTVVGGSVYNEADGDFLDVAAFLCEYSHCLAPHSGPATWLPGNNVAYPRQLLEEYAGVIAEHRWEDRLHGALREAGNELMSFPEIAVGHLKHYSAAEYLSQRFLYSRSFAGMRTSDRTAIVRLVYGCAAFFLPPLLLWRLVSRVWAIRRYRRTLLLSLPLQLIFITSWALGEVVGYWFGPGDSPRKVR